MIYFWGRFFYLICKDICCNILYLMCVVLSVLSDNGWNEMFDLYEICYRMFFIYW